MWEEDFFCRDYLAKCPPFGNLPEKSFCTDGLQIKGSLKRVTNIPLPCITAGLPQWISLDMHLHIYFIYWVHNILYKKVYYFKTDMAQNGGDSCLFSLSRCGIKIIATVCPISCSFLPPTLFCTFPPSPPPQKSSAASQNSFLPSETLGDHLSAKAQSWLAQCQFCWNKSTLQARAQARGASQASVPWPIGLSPYHTTGPLD